MFDCLQEILCYLQSKKIKTMDADTQRDIYNLYSCDSKLKLYVADKVFKVHCWC